MLMLQTLRNSVISHHYKLVHKNHSNLCKTDFNFTNSFFNLLSENFVERRNSSFYAEKLCKSKVQFDFIIKRVTGKLQAITEKKTVIGDFLNYFP